MVVRIDIVDDNCEMRNSLSVLLVAAGHATRIFASAGSFLKDIDLTTDCVIADIYMPEMGGLELQAELATRKIYLPIIMMTGFGDVPLAVRSLQAGAVDFIEKPFSSEVMLAGVKRALSIGSSAGGGSGVQEAKYILSSLTCRERDVLRLLVDGSSNKGAARELGISPRTIENHRASIMEKMNARNLSDVVRVALAAQLAIGTPLALPPSLKQYNA
jgi:two-component system, LuxR family, response regulator FixJ